MKKYIIYSLFVLGMASCEESLLELNPITATSVENFYKTSGDFNTAVNAIYSVLQEKGIENEFELGDLPSDDTFSSTNRITQGDVDFDNLQVKPSSGASANILINRWNNCYVGIAYANTLLDRINGATFAQATKNQYTGEAMFLRAYFYFTLVKTFGDVILVTHEVKSVKESYDYVRVPASQVYEQIQRDLTDAALLLPLKYSSSKDAGRVNSVAARALLARVLLFQSKFSDAQPVLKTVLDNPGGNRILNVCDSVFMTNNGNNREILFAIQYSGTAIGQTAAVTNIFTQGTNLPTNDIYEAFDENDKRRSNFLSGKGGSVSRPINKFKDTTPGYLGGMDYPILRYADVLLMYAECLNESGDVNGAIPYVNQIRARAFGNTTYNYQTTTPSNTTTYISSQEDMRKKILLERRLEFCFEGLRFWDLVRTNNLSILNDYFTKNNIKVNGQILQIQEYQKIFCIPQTIIDINPTKYNQNPGYGFLPVQ